MLVVTGMGSRITQELIPMVNEPVTRWSASDDDLMAERFLLCAGIIDADPHMTMDINYYEPREIMEAVFDVNPNARICVVGSMSGIRGSFDQSYAASKASLHLYVETKALTPNQQLVAVAPWIISDAGMTLRRSDNYAVKAMKHPKGRFITSLEVAHLIRFLLYEDRGYITNTVIQMHGGMR
jgi:3-oxoacyl-[acyl-carrier protein] reductase